MIHRYLPLLLSLTAWLAAPASAVNDIEITLQDPEPFHVHAPSRPFLIDIRVHHAEPARVRYYWRDFRGQSLTRPREIQADETKTVRVPVGKIGYYELVFTTDTTGAALPDELAGKERVYGFAVLPERSTADRHVNRDSPFGVVHADINDPYLTGWSKTSTWISARAVGNPHRVAADRWRSRIDSRRQRGLEELPIILGQPWETDDEKPVPARQVALIGSLSKQYFQADPSVVYWEIGLEENLGGAYKQPYYFANLLVKIKAVRAAADAVNPDIKLVYQIAGLRTSTIREFLRSKAAQEYDILSLHPYAWPDFPSPEVWMKDYLSAARDALAENGLSQMPIWFTEVGAPHHGNYPGEFFGVPSKGRAVTGLTRAAAVGYLIKLHVMALQMGIGKVFWYNYRDRGSERAVAEDHFGLRDYWGYPKPVYVAYVNLHQRLTGKSPKGIRHLPGNVRVFEFQGDDQGCLVAWRYPAGERAVPWTSLRARASQEIVAVVNSVGSPVLTQGGKIPLSGQPIYIITRDAPHAKPP